MLRSGAISRIKPNHNLALGAIKRAKRDVDTAITLIENKKFDWSLAVAYNAMLQAGRALMYEKGYRPPSSEGHVAVVRFLHSAFGTEGSDRMVMVMNGMRKKRRRIVYEEMDVVSKDEAEQAVKWAEEFVGMIDKAIRQAKEEE